MADTNRFMFILRHRATRFVVTVLLLGFLWGVLDGADAVARLTRAEPALIALGLGLTQVQTLALARRWQITSQALGQPLGLPHATREYYVTNLLNLTLPGGVTGDAVRVARVRSATRSAGWSTAAAPVIVERLAGQLALWPIALLGIIAAPWTIGLSTQTTATGLGIVLLCALGLAAMLAINARYNATFRGFLARTGPVLQRAWLRGGIWRAQAGLSLAIMASYLSVFAACAAAIGTPLDTGQIITLVPLTLAAMVIPLSVGGWGFREGAAAALWPLAGLAPEAGLATSLLYGLVCLVGSLPGLLWIWGGTQS